MPSGIAYQQLVLQLGQLTPSQHHQLQRYFQQIDMDAADKLRVRGAFIFRTSMRTLVV
ncbi:MAG: RecB family endonuclease NucS [Motiliproteus sp.]|jgi:RecB family endonuclease NucS